MTPQPLERNLVDRKRDIEELASAGSISQIPNQWYSEGLIYRTRCIVGSGC